jgi:ABC-type transport system involved in cytochrome c biogenesis ATPase subunit
MPKHNPLQKLKDSMNIKNNAIEKFMKRKKVQEVKDVEVYNPSTGQRRMISLPGMSLAEQTALRNQKIKDKKKKKKTKPGYGG